ISTGYTSFFLGLTTVILHNEWVTDWTVAITILGWATLIKGIRKIGFWVKIHEQAQLFQERQMISTIFMILLGMWLIWMSFT
ncbi:MAG: hypothetical protein AAF223_07685, partial [Bacteroidota bacterium]